MNGTNHTDGSVNTKTGQGLFEFGTNQHQREYPKDHVHKEEEPYHEGQVHSHNPLDSKDQRSVANKLEAEEKYHHNKPDSKEVQELKKDPTLPARMHGHEPGKGAKIDAEIQEEEEAEVKKMGKLEDFSEKGNHSSRKGPHHQNPHHSSG